MPHLWKTVFYTTQSVIGISTNLFVVLVILRSRRLSKLEFSKLLINQSVIDAAACITLMFSYFSLYHLQFHLQLTQGVFLDELLCRVWVNDLLLWGLLVSSTYHIVTMSLHKYLQIVHPVLHRKCCHGNRKWLTMVLPWIFGPTYCILTLSGKARITKTGNCEVNVWSSPMTGRILGTIVVMVQFVIPMVIIVLCYTQMLMTIRRRWRPVLTNVDNNRMEEMETSVSNVHDNEERQPINKQRSKRASKLLRGVEIQKNIIQTLSIICICFFLCWVTNTVIFFTINIGLVQPTIYETGLFEFSVMAVFANAVINPFIYMIEFKPFRQVIAQKTCLCDCRNKMDSPVEV